ncbi:MAG: type 4a pilus biogenesis protein PilO [Symbiobacteriia bacterium]
MKRRWQPLTRRERRVVVGGVLVILVLLFYAFVQQPIMRALAAAREDNDLQQSRLELAAAAQRALPGSQNRVAALRQSTSGAGAALPAAQDEPGLLRSLAQLAAARGVTVRELSFSAPVAAAPAEAGGVTSYPFRLAVSGPPTAAWQFLAGLEGLDRLVQIRSVSYQNQMLTLDAAVFSQPAAAGQ